MKTEMKSKPIVRILCMILVLTLFLSGIPQIVLQVLANPNPNAIAVNEDSNQFVSDDILGELMDNRGEFSKTFLKKDHSYVSVLSSSPLHYRDDNENWQSIDNSLKTNGLSVENKDNAVTVELPNELSTDSEVKISNGDNEISLKFIDRIKNSDIEIIEPEISDNKTDAAILSEHENVAAHALYTDVLPNVDIKYDVVSNGLKESIILNEKPAYAPTYSYELSTGKLFVKLLEDNSVVIFSKSEREPEFTIPAPFMFGSETDIEHSYDIEVELNINDNGKYELVYRPSFSWLKSDDRIYPVTIDPSVEVGESKNSQVTISDGKIVNTSNMELTQDSYSNGGTTEMIENATQYRDWWQTEMDVAYLLLLEILKEDDKQLLIKSQESWLEYMESSDDLSKEFFYENKYGVFGMMRRGFLCCEEAELVKVRAYLLLEYLYAISGEIKLVFKWANNID